MVKHHVVKRKLHDADSRTERWLAATPIERLAAVEAIRTTSFATNDIQQTFSRVCKITRKAPR
jgi:hypothetical protein